MTTLANMTLRQIINSNLSQAMISDAIDSKVFIEVKTQVRNYLKHTRDSIGLEYTESDVETIASESAHEVRRRLDGIDSPNDAHLHNWAWIVSAGKCIKFIHGIEIHG